MKNKPVSFMKRAGLRVLLPAILLSGTGLSGAYPQFNALVWSDEFNYAGLPASDKWTCEEGGHGWGNDELQYYTKDRLQNVRVENGQLIIEAHKENYNSREYTSARLVSRGKGDWLYGRIEVRAKLPGGRGTWPAIWMLPTDWAYGNWPASGEIDIMEHVGHDPLKVFGTVHTQAYNHQLGTQKGSSVEGPDFETAFHLYAVEWSADKMDFYVDNTLYFTFNNEGTWEKWPFDKRFHLVMNLAVGGTWGGAQGVDPAIFPQRMVIDYVRVYQKADLGINGPEFLEPGESAQFHCTRFTEAQYEWQVPEGATVTGGQGTADVTVRWGSREGDISVMITIGPEKLNTTRFVKMATVPGDPLFYFGDLKDGYTADLVTATTDGSTYGFTESAEGLRIVYSTVDPASWPRFELLLPRPVNLKDHPWCFIHLRTFNLSNSMTIRFDFADIHGTETNATPVFRPLPVIADGQFHFYSRNFTGRWISSAPEFGKKVDSTRIIKLITYINGGLFGAPNRTDSLWIESIRFQKSPTSSIRQDGDPQPGLIIYPNPANDRVRIHCGLMINHLRVYDMTGNLVADISGIDIPEYELSLRSMSPGVYLIRTLTSDDRILTGRFTKIAELVPLP